MSASPKSVCVYCGSRDGNIPEYAQAAQDTGQMLATNGWRLVYGAGDVGPKSAQPWLDSGKPDAQSCSIADSQDPYLIECAAPISWRRMQMSDRSCMVTGTTTVEISVVRMSLQLDWHRDHWLGCTGRGH